MRITSKGQVTIPVEIREKLGLLPDSEVEFELVGNTARLRKARRPQRVSRGRSLVSRLRSRGSVRMTTDEILAHTRGRR
jgi:AbrB family looped-hinge helix DNA binding protein